MPVHMIGQPKGRSLIVKKPKSCLHSVRLSDFHSQSGFSSQTKKKNCATGRRSHPLLCHFAIFKQIMGSVISYFSDPTAKIPAGKEHQRCRQALINRGADVNVRDYDGMTPLIYAVEENHPQCLNELIKAGADVNETDSEGFTALILAARKRRSRYAGLLIKAGANVDKLDWMRRGALYYSAENSDYKFMEILLKAGADVNPRYANEQFPLFALNSFPLPLVALKSFRLPNNNSNNDAKRHSRHLKSLHMLIKAGADVNVRDRRNLTAMMSVAGNGYTECIRVMVKAGADVNAKTPNGTTALVYATMYGSVNCIKTLLKAGADVNAG